MTVQEALTELLSEDKHILNDSRRLIAALEERMPGEQFKLEPFRKALLNGNIGETLLAVDGADKEVRDHTKAEALVRLSRMMQDRLAKQVVDTLTKAMDWDTEKTAEDYINDGLAAMRENNYEEAVKHFSQAIKMNPDLARAYVMRGSLYANKYKLDQAISDYTQAISIEPSDYLNFYNRGMLYASKGKYDQAMTDYKKAIALSPNDADVYNTRGEMYCNQGEYDLAIADYNQALFLDSKNEKARNGLRKAQDAKNAKSADDYFNDGLVGMREKNYDQAIKNFSQAIEIKPDFAIAYVTRGSSYANKFEIDLAIADYTQAIAIDKDNYLPFYNRGVLYATKGNDDLALADYTQAITLSPKDADVYNTRGKMYYEKGDYSLAIADYNQALTLDSWNEKAKDGIREAQEAMKKAKPWEEKGLREKFFTSKGRLNRKRYFLRGMIIGLVYLVIIFLIWGVSQIPHEKSLAFAVVVIGGAIGIAGFVSSIMLMIRRLHDIDCSGDWLIPLMVINCISCIDGYRLVSFIAMPAYLYLLFKKGTEGVNRYGADPLGGMANHNAQREKVTNIKFAPDAKPPRNIKKIIIAFVAGALVLLVGLFMWGASDSQNKKLAQEHNSRGLSYFNGQQYDKALSEYDQAIKILPEFAEAYNNRGDVYYNQKEYDKALTDYANAIKFNSKYTEAYYNRGMAYYEKDDYDKALADFDQAIKLNPEYAMAYYRRGDIFAYNKKEYDKAIANFNRAIELKPNDYKVYKDRGMAFLVKHESDKSLADFSKAIELNPKGDEAYFGRGSIYFTKEEYDMAIADLDQVININKQNTNAYFLRGRSYYVKEMYNSAFRDFSRVIELDPKNVEAFLYRGLIYDRNMSKYDEAIEDYTQVISLAPTEYSLAYNNRGTLYFGKGNYDQAIDDLQKALAIDPNNDNYKENLRLAKELIGR